MKRFLILFAAGILSFAAHTEPQTLTHGEFDISVDIETQQVIPGMPLYLYMTIKRHEGGAPEPVEVEFYTEYRLNLEIRDRAGEVVGARPPESRSVCGQGFMFDVPLKPGESFRKTIMVHQWCSTELPQGEYTIALKIGRSGGTSTSPLKEFAGDFAFPFKILSRDDNAVRERFATLLKTSIDNEGIPRDNKPRFLAMDTLVFAQGPLALPYQLEFVRLSHDQAWGILFEENRIIELFRYIARSGNAETARQLLEFSELPFLDEEKKPEHANSLGVWVYVSWTIRSLHHTGNEEVKAMTQVFVEKFPKSYYDCPPGHYDDCMIIWQEEY